MKIQKLWKVSDPDPSSELFDVLYGFDVGDLTALIIGTGADVWREEHATLYTECAEAVRDAVSRMVKLHPNNEAEIEALAAWHYPEWVLEAFTYTVGPVGGAPWRTGERWTVAAYIAELHAQSNPNVLLLIVEENTGLAVCAHPDSRGIPVPAPDPVLANHDIVVRWKSGENWRMPPSFKVVA